MSVKKPVPIAFRCKRGSLYLLHHHHEHNQEDGQSRPDDAYRTDDGMLAKLRQRLGDVLFDHIVLNVSRFLSKRLNVLDQTPRRFDSNALTFF